MSLKIYTAYKLKKSSDLWPWLRDTRRRAELEVVGVLRKLYASMGEAVDTDSDDYKERVKNGQSDAYVRLQIAHNTMRERYRDQLTQGQRDTFDFDVNLVVREYQKGLYIIPYGDMMMRHVFDFLKEDSRLVDFAYWNNTDEPDDVTPQQWGRRGHVWNEIDKDARWQDYMVIEVSTWSKFYQIDPHPELLDELRKREKAAKSSG